MAALVASISGFLLERILGPFYKIIKPFIPQITIAIVLVLSFYFYSNHVYKQGEKAAQARFDKLQDESNKRADKLQADLNVLMANVKELRQQRLDELKTSDNKNTTIIEREIKDNPRYINVDQGLTDALFNALNDARSETHK